MVLNRVMIVALPITLARSILHCVCTRPLGAAQLADMAAAAGPGVP